MFSVSTLSTLKYLQKETHYLNDSTENFAFSAFQDQIFFISVLSRFVQRSKPNDQNLGKTTWHLCTVCPKPNDQEAQQATPKKTAQKRPKNGPKMAQNEK